MFHRDFDEGQGRPAQRLVLAEHQRQVASDVRIARDLALVFRKDKALSRAALAFIEIAVKQKTPQTAGVPK